MQESITPTGQLQVAALVFPVIALVVNLAINSVDDGDDWWYRLFIGATGIFAITPAFIVMFLGLYGYMQSEVYDEIFSHLFITFVAVMVQTIAVIIVEIHRGLEEGRGIYLVPAGLLFAVFLLWTLLELI